MKRNVAMILTLILSLSMLSSCSGVSTTAPKDPSISPSQTAAPTLSAEVLASVLVATEGLEEVIRLDTYQDYRSYAADFSDQNDWTVSTRMVRSLELGQFQSLTFYKTPYTDELHQTVYCEYVDRHMTEPEKVALWVFLGEPYGLTDLPVLTDEDISKDDMRFLKEKKDGDYFYKGNDYLHDGTYIDAVYQYRNGRLSGVKIEYNDALIVLDLSHVNLDSYTPDLTIEGMSRVTVLAAYMSFKHADFAIHSLTTIGVFYDPNSEIVD